jgi:nitrite reductase (NADH) small subunit/3-phenylpropionate/trans-cinnamate dioxygenase ferredoxin subunit
MSEEHVARLDELEDGHPVLVERAGKRLAVARAGNEVYACDDTCTHQGGPLSGGKVVGGKLVCPWHGWSFDVRTGVCLFPRRGAPVSVYPVRVDNGDVYVELE